jgi:hypothetical protein
MEVVIPPIGFLNIDLFIECISFLTVLLFSILCIKNYKLNKDKKLLYLGGGFGLITLAELIITVSKAVLYSSASFVGMGGEIAIPYNLFDFVSVFSTIGFFAFRVLFLFGLYVLYKSPKSIFEKDSLLMVYFAIVVTIFSKEVPHLFHITAFIMLLLIVLKYYDVYKKNKSKGTLILVLAFSGMALSNAIFIFARLMSVIYVTASLIALASYITLLLLIVRILEYGKNNDKKKKPNGYNI